MILARNWWLLALRGVLAMIFGLATFVYPEASLSVLVIFFGAYALVDGIFAIIAGATAPRGNPRWGWLIGGGILGVLIGVVAFLFPLATAFALTIYIAIWAIVIGVTQIAVAVRVRKVIKGEIWLILGGIVSVLFGIFALVSPVGGALAVTLAIGVYVFVFGLMMLITALRLRGWHLGRRPHNEVNVGLF